MFSITVDAKSFKSFMKDLKQTTSNLHPAFTDFGKYLKKETDDQFKREVDPDGKPWQPLKASTLKKKKTNTILRETLAMYNSMYFVSKNESFEFGIKDNKYKYHHYGTVKMPARVVVGITSKRRDKLNGFVVAQIRRVKGLRANRSKKK